MMASGMLANDERVECWGMMTSGMLTNDGERMMPSGMLANAGEWNVGE